MIRLKGRNKDYLMIFLIENKVINVLMLGYKFPYYPMNLIEVNKTITMSRGKVRQDASKLFDLHELDIEESNNAKTDEEFKEILMRDSKKWNVGLKEVNEKMEEIN
jgi:hypothetical protein